VTLDILNQSERLTAAQVIQANLADVGIDLRDQAKRQRDLLDAR
jgi:hypothetical protein